METKEKQYPFYWRGIGGWGSNYSGYGFLVIYGRELLIYDPKGKRVHDERYEDEEAAYDAAYQWAHEHLGAPLPQ